MECLQIIKDSHKCKQTTHNYEKGASISSHHEVTLTPTVNNYKTGKNVYEATVFRFSETSSTGM